MARILRDYSHRDVLDKLGLKPGQLVAFDEAAGSIDGDLKARALNRSGSPDTVDGEAIDIVLAAATADTDAVELLSRWRARIQPAGAIWIFTPKRGRPGYVNHVELIEAGKEAGVVDNKICSVSEDVSAMRFVIRRGERLAVSR